MTLRIHAPNPMRVGETANVIVTSDNPGVVSLTYGAGLTGPATVTIPGTRVWSNGLKHGQYLARVHGANDGQQREDQSWCIEIQTKNILRATNWSNYSYAVAQIVQSARTDNTAGANRVNWMIGFLSWRSTATSYAFIPVFARSINSTAVPDYKTATAKSLTSESLIRLIVINTGGNVSFYHTTGTVANSTHALNVSSGTMGGTEHLLIEFPAKISKFNRVLSQSDREGFCQSGTLPSSPEFSHQGGHEIIESSPVFYDIGSSSLDVTAVTPYMFAPAAASGDYTDDPLNPVVPYALVPVTAIATTGTTIDATRPRQGVPARASYSERTEVADQCVVTVNDPVGAVGPAITARVKR